jgi:hypothetical protein
MRAKPDHPFLRSAFPRAFEQYFESRTATRLAQVCDVETSTITRERGPRLERYSAPEFAEMLVDDIGGGRVMLGALLAIAERRAASPAPAGGAWLVSELSSAVQEMLGDSGKAVAALADGEISARERSDLAKDLRSLVGHLSLLLEHLDGETEAGRVSA